jgi:hypothetical protein
MALSSLESLESPGAVRGDGARAGDPGDPGELHEAARPPTGALHPAARLTLRPLSVVPQGEDLLVGDPATGTFLALPEVGLVALRALQAGDTIAEAAVAAAAHAGQEVDVLDFAETLIESGLVVAIDGQPVDGQPVDGQPSAPVATSRGPSWLAGLVPALAGPFFSAPAWTLYGLAFVACAALFVARPQLWPRYEDAFFYPDPAVCLVAMTLATTLLTAGHELCHWLAARAAGVGARFGVSRRAFFPVFESDLSQLWSVPRGRRYSAFLAGMAFDTLVLAISLGLRSLWATGLLDLPPLLGRFLGAVVLVQVLGLGWQALVFLRTDLYAVLITALGCFNLSRLTTLSLKRIVRRLRPAEAAELQTAHPRDAQVVRWFVWLYLAGFLGVLYVFVNFFLPGTVVLAGWMFGSLWGAPLGSTAFWEASTIGGIAAAQAVLPLAIFVWQRRRAPRGATA